MQHSVLKSTWRRRVAHAMYCRNWLIFIRPGVWTLDICTVLQASCTQSIHHRYSVYSLITRLGCSERATRRIDYLPREPWSVLEVHIWTDRCGNTNAQLPLRVTWYSGRVHALIWWLISAEHCYSVCPVVIVYSCHIAPSWLSALGWGLFFESSENQNFVCSS